jgi:trk system potassium uptake protein TrkH
MLMGGFGAMIILGTLLLMFPIASRSGEWTPFVDALFTSTSAVCVTGLVVVDTLDYWTIFGQAVILVLIQLGGFGFMTSATVFLVALGRRIGLRERLLIRESVGVTQLGGLLRIILGMGIFTIAAEVIGAIVFYIRFSGEYPLGTAVWKSVFQSVSAFNNAGFDVFGGFRSISEYHNSPLVVLTTAALVILGGISFLVLRDISLNRSLRKLSVDTKLVLSVTMSLLLLGMVVVLITEFGNTGSLGEMTLPQKLLNAFFQSVTSRTAGFSSFSTANMTDYALFFVMLLMFVGGASGSTAGGIKVNTFGMLISTIWDSIRGKEYPGVFGREFTSQQIFRALAIIMLALVLVTVVTFLLAVTEGFPFLKVLFETVSAFGTVGLSTGITPELSVLGRILITITMFAGRLGPLTLTLALIARQRPTVYRYPKEVIRIG